MSYDYSTNSISYQPKEIDGDELRSVAGDTIIMITLLDDRGNQSNFEMTVEFMIPISFSSDLPTFNLTAGKFASVELPEIIVEDGYSEKELIVQPEIDLLSRDLYYDP